MRSLFEPDPNPMSAGKLLLGALSRAAVGDGVNRWESSLPLRQPVGIGIVSPARRRLANRQCWQ